MRPLVRRALFGSAAALVPASVALASSHHPLAPDTRVTRRWLPYNDATPDPKDAPTAASPCVSLVADPEGGNRVDFRAGSSASLSSDLEVKMVKMGVGSDGWPWFEVGGKWRRARLD